jgi:hypothetical protein
MMAVYTKLRHKRILRLYADQSCYQDRALVRVWTVAEGESTPVRRFLSDLYADRGQYEIFDIVRANAKTQSDPYNQISFWP